eukprot:10096629-Alexandrium_andersonii.AAC.1
MGLDPSGNARSGPDPRHKRPDGDRRAAVRVVVAAARGPNPVLPGPRVAGPRLEKVPRGGQRM